MLLTTLNVEGSAGSLETNPYEFEDAARLSANGQVVIGRGGWYWNRGTGDVRPVPFSSDNTNPIDLSADGSVVMATDSSGPFIWTASGGMVRLDVTGLPTYLSPYATALSGDGHTVVGYALGAPFYDLFPPSPYGDAAKATPFPGSYYGSQVIPLKWVDAGTRETLSTAHSEALVSAFVSEFATAYYVKRGTRNLTDVRQGIPTAVSTDGSVIAGQIQASLYDATFSTPSVTFDEGEAFYAAGIWNSGKPLRRLAWYQYLTATNWNDGSHTKPLDWQFTEVHMSADASLVYGQFVSGTKQQPARNNFAWTAKTGFRVANFRTIAASADATYQVGTSNPEPLIANANGILVPATHSVRIPSGATRPVADLALAAGISGDEFEPLGTPIDIASTASELVILYPKGVLSVERPLNDPPAPPAEPGTMLTSTGTVRPSVRFSETFVEQAAVQGNGSLTKMPHDPWTVTATASLAGLNPASVTGDSTLEFSLGDFSFSQKLSDDPTWKSGKRHAHWMVGSGSSLASGGIVVTANWTATALTLTAHGTGANSLALAHRPFDGWQGPIAQQLAFTIGFGDVFGATNQVSASGTASRFPTYQPGSSTKGLVRYRVAEAGASVAPR